MRHNDSTLGPDAERRTRAELAQAYQIGGAPDDMIPSMVEGLCQVAEAKADRLLSWIMANPDGCDCMPLSPEDRAFLGQLVAEEIVERRFEAFGVDLTDDEFEDAVEAHLAAFTPALD